MSAGRTVGDGASASRRSALRRSGPEIVGFLLLAPWTVAMAGADAPIDAQLALFVLPLLALLIGIAGLYAVLGGAVERARVVAALVLVACACLVGSVVHDSLTNGEKPRVHLAKTEAE
jgi:hypothetical protein